MSISKMTVKDIAGNLKGKAVAMRVDFNVPMEGKSEARTITDDTRIQAALPTIKYVLEHGAAKLVLMSHLGDPKKEQKKAEEKQGAAFDKAAFDKDIKMKLSLKPVAEHLSKVLGKPVQMASATFGADVEAMVAALPEGGILMLENTRFHKEETSKDEADRKKMAESIAKGMNIYVNDAFGTAHRAHASTETMAQFLPAVAGLLMEKEIEFLSEKVLKSPAKPFVAIVGGAKVSSKIGVIENLLDKTDAIIIGGGMAFTFFKAMGYNVGASLIEDDQLDVAKKTLDAAKAKGVQFLLPSDVVVADKFAADANSKVVKCTEIPEGWMGLDAGPQSIDEVVAVLKTAKTVFWNGPLGVFEFDKFAAGTNAVALCLAELNNCITVIGGGDSVAAVNKAGVASKMTHISTGGGASMELIEGKVMPGLDALMDQGSCGCDSSCGC
ncbi:MAG: phosphoglycerate kinase [Brevinema sp.]